MTPLNRRNLLKLGLGAAALSSLPRLLAQTAAPATPAAAASKAPAATPPVSTLPLITKAIPSTGEQIPVVGIGTRTYSSLTDEIRNVITSLAQSGCRMIDTADNYAGGNSETAIGDAVAAAGIRNSVFLATKVNSGNRGKAAGQANLDASFRKLKAEKIDLIYVHNLTETEVQLENLRALKAAGRIRYLGVTTSSDNQYGQLETLMRNQQLDFVQLDYAIDNRGVEARLLPLAIERKIAIVTNLPFGRANLFAKVGSRSVPEWAAEFDCKTWGQFFLKYNVSHPAVTVAIPGTTQMRNLLDNVQAARGRLPDAAMRRRMEQYMEALPAA